MRPRDLARDPSLPSALLALRNEFRVPEASTALGHILDESPPGVVVVHGKPGCGKSGLLLRITEALIERGMPVLPLSLSSRPPVGSVYEYGTSLGLHATPAAALRATAAGSCAVMLLDQLDALRVTSSGAAATWQICAQMLREALGVPGLVVVLACRTFDLENDPNIRSWRDSVKRSHPQGAADRFSEELAPQTRSIQNRLGMAGRDLSALLLRLYDAALKAGNRELAEACLDRWDRMIANRVGQADADLDAFSW